MTSNRHPRTTDSPLACVACGKYQVGVTDSRPNAAQNYIRRRKRCAGCGAKWTTQEIVVGDKARANQLPLDFANRWHRLTSTEQAMIMKLMEMLGLNRSKAGYMTVQDLRA